MTAAADWIAKRREHLNSAAVARFYGVSLTLDERECKEHARALDALEKVLEKVQPHRRIVMPGGSVDEHDYVGELADDIEQLITEALGVEP